MHVSVRIIPYADVNGVRIYFELYGKGETIVFLNGILANTLSWVNQVSFFSKRFQVLVLDFRGQGKSEKPAMKYPMEIHADDLEALLNHLKMHRVHAIGVSFGAEVALVFATKYPERLKSLVVACAVSHVGPAVKIMAQRWLAAAKRAHARRNGKHLFETVYPDIFSNEFIEKKWKLIESTARFYTISVDMAAFSELIRGFMRLNVTPELSTIKTPTLVIAAEKDKLKPPRYSKLIHKKIKGSEFAIVKDSGHTVIWEKPEEFNEIVMEFIENSS